MKYDSKLPRADDIVAAISSQFAAGMARLREEFEAKMRSATVNIDSLGEPLIQAPLADGSSLAVYSTNLSKAHQSIKVMEQTSHIDGLAFPAQYLEA